MYDWIEAYGPRSEAAQAARPEQDEVRHLKPELKQVTQERDILKEAGRYFAQESNEVPIYSIAPTQISIDRNVPFA